MSAAQQAGQQPVPAANRAARHHTHPGGVVGDHALVPFILRPGNIALVVIHDQYIPLLTFPVQPTPDALAPILDGDTAPRSTEGVGAAVDRIGQQFVNRAVHGQLPRHAPAFAFVLDRRQSHVLLTEPQMHLPDALQRSELPEHQPDRLLHAPVRVLGDAVVPDLDVADRDAEEQLTAPRLLAQGFERALAQQRQLQWSSWGSSSRSATKPSGGR